MDAFGLLGDFILEGGVPSSEDGIDYNDAIKCFKQMKKKGDPSQKAIGKTKMKSLEATVKLRERAPLVGCLVKIFNMRKPHWHGRQGKALRWLEKTNSYVVEMKDPVLDSSYNGMRTNEFKARHLVLLWDKYRKVPKDETPTHAAAAAAAGNDEEEDEEDEDQVKEARAGEDRGEDGGEEIN